MKDYLFVFISFLLVIYFTDLHSQSYIVPTSGYLEIHSDSGKLFDDGGENSNYSTRVNSVVTIYPSYQGGYVRLSGQYNLEEWNKSRVLFFSGDTNSNNQICSISDDGCIDVRSNSGPLTIKFFADTETPDFGFEFDIYVCNDLPINITSEIITDTSVAISWSENNTSTNWIVEYSEGWFSLGSGTKIYSDTNVVNLENLNKCSRYYYYIYSTCDTVGLSCSNKCGYDIYSFFTKKNHDESIIGNIQSTCNEISLSWEEIDTNITWLVSLSNGDYIYTDVPYCVFDSLNSGQLYSIRIIDSALSNFINSECACSPKIYTKCCCPIANNLIVSSIQANEALISWDADTSATGWIVVYWRNNDYFYDTIIVDTNFVLLSNLSPVNPYEVVVYSLCDSMNINCSRNINFFSAPSSSDNCLSFTDFNSPNFLSTYGNYSNPYQSYGLINYGYLDASSRHTIHYDTLEVDIRTGGLLHTVPQGEEVSVRLGNWLAGAEAEGCTYLYYVDTNNYDMFILQYAIVLEDPNHTQQQQPRFTLEILDSNQNLVNDQCGYTNFYASGDLDWNSVSGTNIIWKDWTSSGIDISKYHNQNIYIRFTTYDCDEGGHFGYAYYNIKCGSKYLNKSSCGQVDSLLFEAPLGFDYLWYNANQPDDTISKENQLTVPVDNNTYYCRCSYKENSDCNFILSFEAQRQFPYPLFDYSLDTCGYKINFSNQSIISKSDTIAIEIEKCNDVKWIFHDGTVSLLQNPSFNYDSSGVYPIILIASMNEGVCVDTLFANIIVDNSGFHQIEFFGDTVICRGSQTEISINEFDSYEWSSGEATSSVLLSPIETSTYFVKAYENGCLRYDSITIYVTPFYSNDTITGVVCEGRYYNSNGFYENEEGFYTNIYKAVNGCDSIINLELTVAEEIDSYSLIDDKYIIVEDMPYEIDVSCDYCYNYLWNTGSNDSILIVNNYGNYYVRMQHVCGMIYDSIIIVKPDVNVFLPNAFTPDFLSNNTFFPIFENKNSVTIESFEIYNRNGELIYSSTTNPWNGNYNNTRCYSGAYAWKLVYRTKYSDGIMFEKSGIVNLIR
jgi:hypothetical protein